MPRGEGGTHDSRVRAQTAREGRRVQLQGGTHGWEGEGVHALERGAHLSPRGHKRAPRDMRDPWGAYISLGTHT
jgi:hypothetical protein